MIKLLVIADDFTGALDTGVQFSKQGVATLVATDNQLCFKDIGNEIEVLVLDIESRHVSAGEAYKRVGNVVKKAIETGIDYIYKKTDSTLRGNIGAELAALLDISSRNQLPFIPAFPKNHRITVNGIQYVSGEEINKTVFAQDPFTPVKHSSIIDIIRQQSNITTESISTENYIRTEKEYQEKTICIFDAQTDLDMEKIGRELKKTNRLNILAGCAGFAEILPELLELKKGEMKWQGNKENVLIVSGSVNQIAIDQISFAKKRGYRAITLSPKQKLNSHCHEFQDFNKDNLDDKIIKGLKEFHKVILESVSSREQILITKEFAINKGIPLETIPFCIVNNMGEIVKRVLDKFLIGNLLVFGGDTLFGIIDKIQCEGIFPIKEIAPGVVAAKAVFKDGKFLRILTKAGGFGEIDIINIIDEFIFGS